MDRLRLDFETFSELDIKKVGAIRYAECPTTEPLILAYKSKQIELNAITSFGWDEIPDDLRYGISSGELLLTAFNCAFERAIIEDVLCKRYGWPKPDPRLYRCTQALCGSLSLPLSLEKAAQVLNLDDGKDKRGKELIKLFSGMHKPRKTKKNPDATPYRVYPEDEWDQFQEFIAYCRQDVIVEEGIDLKLAKLQMTRSEVELWHLDQTINRRGIPLDIPTAKKAMAMVETHTKNLLGPFADLTGGLKPTQREKVLNWLNDRGCNLPNLTADTLADFLKNPPEGIPQECIEVVEIRTSASRSSNSKLVSMVECVSEDGRARGTLQFDGALKTGRWAGRLIQPHNFPRPQIKQTEMALNIIKHHELDDLIMLWGDPLKAISATLRHMIAAQTGYEFIVADYSAIEGRGVCWLAQQWDAVERYIKGVDAYCHMATAIYPELSYDTIKARNDFERQLGKQAVLGCGYQMGGERFQETCEGYGMDVSRALADKTVAAYREQHPKVRNYWYEVERCAIRAIQTGTVIRHLNLKFAVIQDFLFIILPSGRRMAYPHPRLVNKKTSWGDDKQTIRYTGVKNGNIVTEYTYGGKLTENITQATARDLMAYGMKVAEKAGYKIITTIHDEIVSEVEANTGDVTEFENLISRLPMWAEAEKLPFPLKAEGYRDVIYRKG